MCELCAHTTTLAAGTVEGQDVLQRLEHMAVAQVPGGARAIVHDAVVVLGIGDETRILRGIEEPLTIVAPVVVLFLQKLDQHVRDVPLALPIGTGERRVAIGAGVGLPG